MQTQNIISTPDITGNIGSCTSNTTSMSVSGDFWGRVNQDIVTNSCTGQTITGGKYYESNYLGIFILGVCIIFLGSILAAAILNALDN